jgi:hypothetical protein
MPDTKDHVLAMFDSYNETAQEALDAIDAGEEYEGQDPSDFLDEWPLSLDTSIIVDIMLGVGGPTAYIHCEVSKGNYGTLEIDRATFIASWGGDKRETPLSMGDALYAVANRYIEAMEA